MITNNYNKSTSVYIVNSRLPVYNVYYGEGLVDIIRGLFTRIAPKIAPVAKELLIKGIGIIRDKGKSTIGDLTGSTFDTAKER